MNRSRLVNLLRFVACFKLPSLAHIQSSRVETWLVGLEIFRGKHCFGMHFMNRFRDTCVFFFFFFFFLLLSFFFFFFLAGNISWY